MSDFYTNVAQIKDNILYRGITEDGKRIRKKIPFQPHLFIDTKVESKFKTLDGLNVDKVKMDSIMEAKDFIKRYKDIGNVDVYGNENFISQFIGDWFPDDIPWDIDKIRICNIDMEVASENGFPDVENCAEEIQIITIREKDSFIVFGVGDYAPHKEGIVYRKYDTEKEMLINFLDFWVKYYPDIITGWNTSMFDIPYLAKRIEKILGEKEVKKLSPWGIVHERFVEIYGRSNSVYNITGIAGVDYLDLYRKFAFTTQEKYTLGHVAFAEGVGSKIDYSEYDNLHTLYKENFQLYVEYNIQDVELVGELEEKMGLISLALTMAYDAKVNYGDVFSQVRMWDTLIYNHLRKRNLVMPHKKPARKDTMYEGAYVKDPVVGFHNWVVSFDLDSLYPHLIMQYNISPETLDVDHTDVMEVGEITVDKMLKKELDLSWLKDANLTITPNDQYFHLEKQGFLSEMMETMYKDRVRYKTSMIQAQKDFEIDKSNNVRNRISKYKNLQMAKKIQLNSAYGALGNQYFRLFDVRLAEAITKSGQLSIRWIENRLDDYFNRVMKTKNEKFVIASDTDSVYLCLEKIIESQFSADESPDKIVSFLDKMSEQVLQPIIDKSYDELAEYVNSHQKMRMSREAIADKAIWTAKKRYILNVWDMEGVRHTEPELKISGIEAIKSSTPSACREKIKEALKMMMESDEESLIRFVAKFRNEFSKLPVEEISWPRSVNGVRKYVLNKNGSFKPKTPIHVRGSLIYNKLLKENNLEIKYPKIQEGEKIKFIYLKEPNPTRGNIISFPTSLPVEFKLHKYIDFKMQFEKSFLEPLRVISDKILWELEERASIEGFFNVT